MPNTKQILRLLLVEDSEERHKLISGWLPPDVRLVWAKNAGQALGILKRDGERVYAGIMLDFDLQQQVMTPGGSQFTGGDVARMIMQRVSPETPILMHSMNFAEGGPTAEALAKNGFPVTRAPMAELTAVRFAEWLAEVRERFDSQ